jgi:hypothetical protein
LFEPSQALAAHMRMPAPDTRKELREAGYGLRRLVDGDLAGMFDGPTTGGIDLQAPMVAFDLSRITDYTSLGVVMICVAAWLRRLLAESDDGVRRIIVYEAWKVLRVPGVARFLNESWKMARQWGVQNVAVMHRLSDLASVADAGSEAIELAKGLLSDSQTRRLPAGEQRARQPARAAPAHRARGGRRQRPVAGRCLVEGGPA